MKTLFRIGLLILAAGLSSCMLSSRGYVDEITGYSVTEGRITRIVSLDSENMEPLTDGMAYTVSHSGCRVSMTFENGESKEFDLGRGVIIVHGYKSDFILQSELGSENR